MKGGFNRVLYNNIKNVNSEEDLACELVKDETLMVFSKTIFWEILTKIKKVFPNKSEFTSFVKPKMLYKKEEEVNGEIILGQIGYSEVEAEAIIDAVFRENGKTRFINSNGIPFLDPGNTDFSAHALTRMLTALNNPECQSLYIRNDPRLFRRFIEELRQHYNLPLDFTEEEFNTIYNEKTTSGEHQQEYKESFDMLVTKLLHMSDNYKSIIQQNYGREIFTRRDKNSSVQKNSIDFPKCFTNLSISGANKIYGIENFLELEGTFTKVIFEHYDKKVVGGISGSSYYLYFFIFEILGYPRDKVENFSKVLCLCILDYVPLWHNLAEILLTFSIEFEQSGYAAISNRYFLNEDPLEYFKTFLSKFSNNLSLSNNRHTLVRNKSFGGKKRTTRRKRKLG